VNVCCEARSVKKKALETQNHFGPIWGTRLRSAAALVYDFAGTGKKSKSRLIAAKEWQLLQAQ
jgi:hypothetical protein